MKHPFFPLACALMLVLPLGACKKAAEPVEPSATANESSTTQDRSTAAASAKSSAGVGEAVSLKVKWPVGNRYVYRMDLDQQSTNNIPQMPKPMLQNVTMAMTYALSVIKETADDGRELEMEFLANEMEYEIGEQVLISFDSKESDDGAAPNPLVAPFKKMIGSKVHLLLDATGKLDKVINLEEWVKTLAGEGGAAKGLIAQQFNEEYFRQVADFSRGLPSKPVRVGESWPFKMDVAASPLGKIAVDSMVTFKGMEDRDAHRCAILEAIGEFAGGGGGEGAPAGLMRKTSVEQGKLSATSWFDPALGALVELVANQSMRITAEMPGASGSKRPPGQLTSDIAQKVSLKLVELKASAP